MNETMLHLIGHRLELLFNYWWLLLSWLVGGWSLVITSPGLSKKGWGREAQLAFWGGWFWLLVGLIGFLGAKIFSRLF